MSSSRVSPIGRSETDVNMRSSLLELAHYRHLGLHVIDIEGEENDSWTEVNSNSTESAVLTNANQSVVQIEEENSRDNEFPAIGHLESFKIERAEDGSLLPSTVNAKMADGSYQRLTLYPQIVDGNVTCTVQFENVNQEKPAEIPQNYLAHKIDQLIMENDGILNGKPGRLHNALPMPSTKATMRPAILHARKTNKAISRPKPTQLTSQVRSILAQLEKKKRGSVIQRSDVKNNGKISVLKRSHMKESISSKVSPVESEVSIMPKLIKATVPIPVLSNKLVPAVKGIPSTLKMKAPMLSVPLKATANSPHAAPVKKPNIVNGSMALKEKRKFFLTSKPLSTKKSSESSPLGSASNPITLIQDGNLYQSQHPLTDKQVEQITAILEKHCDNLPANENNLLIDPETKSRILYKVIYPEDQPEEVEPKKILIKRGRRPRKALKTCVDVAEKSKENLDPPPVPGSSFSTAVVDEPQKDTPNRNNSKVVQLSRTRSGRLSRLPEHIARNYKIIDPGPESKKAKKDLPIIDYEAPVAPPVSATTTPTIPLNQYIKTRQMKSLNIKSDYRCPTCKKVYFGHERMMLHLKKFPLHSNLSEYARNFQKQVKPVKPLRNKRRMLRMVSRMERSAYGPMLAKAFSVWEFMLLRVGLMEKDGTNEVDFILTELNGLLEKIRLVFEELLVPIYDNEGGKDDLCVHLEKMDIAYVLGMAQGSYKINQELLHLLRLEDTSSPHDPKEIPCPPPPPPPPPKTPELATNFEPNLSNKLMECSNDSIDLDCSSKDIDNYEEKKEWVSERVEDTSSEFLSEFLENGLPSGTETLALWKENSEIKNEPQPPEQPEMWKDGESPFAANNGDLWKRTKAQGKVWTERQQQQHWKPSVWDATAMPPRDGQEPSMWSNNKNNGEPWGKPEKWDGNAVPAPGMRASRLTSTPETASALFSPPLRRNSVSGFTSSHQEELLSLDLQELFEDLIPEPTKDDPKPGSIESIINEALFPGSEPPPPHTAIPPLINNELDEFGFS